MKKRLSRNKGFTLVECIIAVAVFGLMSLVVFMILTNASVRATKASESEENLAQLIENVVGDETYKKYDASSRNLTLYIDNNSSKELTVTYNVISGYKNFVECPNTTMGGAACLHHANFTEFMSDSATSMVPHNDPSTFDVATNFFVCPSCGNQVIFTLSCPDCGTTDSYNKTSSHSASGYLFTYIQNGTNGFECSVCGSTAVMAVDAAGNFISEKVSVDGFNVSGMVPNGIRYGEAIDWNYWDDMSTANHRMDLCKFREVNAADPTLPSAQYNTNGGIQASLSYLGTANSSYAGEYSLRLYANSLPGALSVSNPFFVEVVFPVGYTITYDLTKFTKVSRGTKVINGTTYPTLLFKRSAGMTGDVIEENSGTFTFKLTSAESGYSFEYDYNRLSSESDTKQGLFRWFGFNSVTVPGGNGRTTEGYLISASAAGFPIAN